MTDQELFDYLAADIEEAEENAYATELDKDTALARSFIALPSGRRIPVYECSWMYEYHDGEFDVDVNDTFPEHIHLVLGGNAVVWTDTHKEISDEIDKLDEGRVYIEIHLKKF